MEERSVFGVDASAICIVVLLRRGKVGGSNEVMGRENVSGSFGLNRSLSVPNLANIPLFMPAFF